jgi:hypothetical protein
MRKKLKSPFKNVFKKLDRVKAPNIVYLILNACRKERNNYFDVVHLSFSSQFI